MSKFSPSGCEDIGIRIFEFVAINQLELSEENLTINKVRNKTYTYNAWLKSRNL